MDRSGQTANLLPKEKVDAIVVGSGAAGSAMAARLAEGGKKVVLLEGGPMRTAGDLVSSALYARRLKWSGSPVTEEGKDPVGYVFNAAFGVGGAAMHHYAVWPRLHPEDFDMRARYGRGLDWPVQYADLAPYYDRVQTEVGVAGDAAKETWRPQGAFAVETPRLLLASANNAHPQGLGNSTGLVGRYITTHTAGLVYGMFDEETEPHRGAFGGQLLNQDSYKKTTHAAQGAFGSYQWMIAQAVRPNDLLGIATTQADLFGAPLLDFMQRAAHGFGGMTAVVEDLPQPQNQVTLQAAKDRYGVPLAKVVHDSHPESVALWRASLVEGKAVLHAAGAHEVWTGPPGRMHIMGGTIMGRTRADSVTNSFGQLHDIPNLVVAGPGLFPTSGGVNPTFTVHALAARSAERMLTHWRAIAA